MLCLFYSIQSGSGNYNFIINAELDIKDMKVTRYDIYCSIKLQVFTIPSNLTVVFFFLDYVHCITFYKYTVLVKRNAH